MQNASADPTVSGGLDEAIILSTADPRLAKDIKDNERPKIPMTSNLGDDCPPASAGFPAVDSLASPQTTYKYGPMGSRSKRRISTTGELSEDDERIAIVNHDPNYDQDEDESELQDRDDAQRGFREAPPASIGYPPVDGIARRFDRHPDFPDLDSSDDESSKLTSNNQNTSRQPPEEPPSLTMSIFNSGGSVVPFRHRMLSILASMGINLVLPFINGVMLGFGEIFAREWVSIYFGIGPHSLPGAPTRGVPASTVRRVGVRAAADQAGGNVKPDHAAGKTALETAAHVLKE